MIQSSRHFFLIFVSIISLITVLPESLCAQQTEPQPTPILPPSQPSQPSQLPTQLETTDDIIQAQLRQAGLIQPSSQATDTLFEEETGISPIAPTDSLSTNISDIIDEPLSGIPPPDDIPDILKNQAAVNSLTELPVDLTDQGQSKFSKIAASINLTQQYSSNQTISTNQEAESFFTTISPSIGFRSSEQGGAILTLSGSYNPEFRTYQKGNFEDTLNHAGSLELTLEGARTTLNLQSNYSQTSGSNRLVGNFTEQTSLGITLAANQQISAKTSLFTNFNYSEQSVSTNVFGDTETYNISIGGSYEVSSLTRIGPSIRYSVTESPLRPRLSSLALLANINYDPSEKLSFRLNLGLERSERENSGIDPTTSPTAGINMTYAINPLWNLSGDINYSIVSQNNNLRNPTNSIEQLDLIGQGGRNDNDPQINGNITLSYSYDDTWGASISTSYRTAPSFNAVDETLVDTNYNLSINRTFSSSSISAYLRYSETSFPSSGFASSRGDERNTSYGLSFSHPSIFDNLSLAMNISQQTNSGNRDFEQFATSLSFTYTF